MLFIYRFISGYLRLLFYGEFSEQILNIAAQNRITLWDARLVKKGIEANITVKNFKRLREKIRKSHVRVHILAKKGLPFRVNKNKKRIGVLLGIIIMAVFLKLMSNSIWVIDVTGNSHVNESEIISACEDIGIKIGIKKDKISPKNQREKLLLKFEKLSWASLNIEGCKLTVNVSETKPIDKNPPPCNLKAKTDGIISKIDVTTGNCLVKAGDTVKKGDVLVSGVVEKSDSTAFVAATGTITATTKRSITVNGEYIKTEALKTGEIKNKYVLELFGFKIPLYLGSEKTDYEESYSKKSLTLFKNKLPITLHKKEFRYISVKNISLSRQDLISELEAETEKILKELNTLNYTVESREETETENGISLTSIICAEENITYKDPILVDEETLAEK